MLYTAPCVHFYAGRMLQMRCSKHYVLKPAFQAENVAQFVQLWPEMPKGLESVSSTARTRRVGTPCLCSCRSVILGYTESWRGGKVFFHFFSQLFNEKHVFRKRYYIPRMKWHPPSGWPRAAGGMSMRWHPSPMILIRNVSEPRVQLSRGRSFCLIELPGESPHTSLGNRAVQSLGFYYKILYQ